MHRPTCFVKIENIPQSVSRQDIVTLFNSIIGGLREAEQLVRDASGHGGYLELTFSTSDAAKKALCMSGYTIAGAPLGPAESWAIKLHSATKNDICYISSLVTAMSAPPASPTTVLARPQSLDMRRNLYVLGLPFEFTKSEFAAHFATHGTVSHCVILATVDSASRRRGFVVMSTHDEAQRAMGSLSGTNIGRHMIDISWAVVQRSQGFLDGGDRTMALASDQTSSASSDSRNGPGGGDSRLTATIPARTSFTAFPNADPSFLPAEPTNVALLVTNLPPLLFSQISDLEPLLCPYGPIVRVEFLGSCSGLNSNLGPGSNIDQNTNRNLVLDGKMTSTSVIVEYTNLASAQEAKLCLHGQVYAGFGLEVDYVRGSPAGRTGVPVLASFHVATLPSSPNTMPQTYSGSGSGVKKAEHRDENNNGPFSYMSLNPLAAPFVLNTHSSQQDFSSVAANVGAGPDDKMHSFNPFFHNQLLGAQPSGLLADVQAKPEARCQNRSRKNGHQRGYQHYEYQNSTYALPNRPFGYDQTSTSTTGTGLKSGFVNLKRSSEFQDTSSRAPYPPMNRGQFSTSYA